MSTNPYMVSLKEMEQRIKQQQARQRQIVESLGLSFKGSLTRTLADTSGHELSKLMEGRRDEKSI